MRYDLSKALGAPRVASGTAAQQTAPISFALRKKSAQQAVALDLLPQFSPMRFGNNIPLRFAENRIASLYSSQVTADELHRVAADFIAMGLGENPIGIDGDGNPRVLSIDTCAAEALSSLVSEVEVHLAGLDHLPREIAQRLVQEGKMNYLIDEDQYYLATEIRLTAFDVEQLMRAVVLAKPGATN